METIENMTNEELKKFIRNQNEMIEHVISSYKKDNKETKSRYHMTIGSLIKSIRKYKKENSLIGIPVTLSSTGSPFLGRKQANSNKRNMINFAGRGITTPHSYRGNYADLAFTPNGNWTVKDLFNSLTSIKGTEFTGWKGGEYLMDNDTPIWISNVGECWGIAVIDVKFSPYCMELVCKQVHDYM